MECCQEQECVGCDCQKADVIDKHKMVLLLRNFREHVLREGFQKVRCSVAMERARICAACPYNISEMSEGGRVFYELIRELRGLLSPLDQTWHEAEIDYCLKSNWTLELKVWLTAETLRETQLETTKYPSHCWMHKP